MSLFWGQIPKSPTRSKLETAMVVDRAIRVGKRASCRFNIPTALQPIHQFLPRGRKLLDRAAN